MAANKLKPARKQYFLSVYMAPAMRDTLRAISIRTGISQQRLMRDGISLILRKHGERVTK